MDAPDTELEALRFVGPATAELLREADVDAADVAERRVSHAALVEAGVNGGVAARIRREHSLSWTFDADGGDLDRRAESVRGLGDDERAWVAASSGDWDASLDDRATTDGSGDAAAEEAAWRERSKPRPVTELEGVDDPTAARLADAGVRSIRSLATADPAEVADSLDLPEESVARWREAAAERYEDSLST